MVSVGFESKQTISERTMNVKGAICYKRQLYRAREHPERAQWWIDLEQNVGSTFHKKTKHEGILLIDSNWIFLTKSLVFVPN